MGVRLLSRLALARQAKATLHPPAFYTIEFTSPNSRRVYFWVYLFDLDLYPLRLQWFMRRCESHSRLGDFRIFRPIRPSGTPLNDNARDGYGTAIPAGEPPFGDALIDGAAR